MLQRAASWPTANNGGRVPYCMEKYRKDGYRQDCSGYVSITAKTGERKSHLAYEQRGGFGTDHRPLGYGLEPDSEYRAVRLKNVTR
ncbi:hypothetical protein [Lentzea nigeriaca]|uniref:hypothetical protein n=1 Tax=Lentzea nigeriaca TaxID=1128665 RepID=UPI00195D44ED|nr:hypothetical protein [Lentzea nigeriaca]MBM7863513.1 hypothetical protein [Lentzea nigeriaca]